MGPRAFGADDDWSLSTPRFRKPRFLAIVHTQGLRLTDFYAAAPICAPSRAGLMTGRWPTRTGIWWNPPKRLNDGELTIADVLHDRGYATAIVGKWHLGWVAEDFPTHHGFDYYYGLPAGMEGAIVFIRGDQPTKDGVGIDLLTRKLNDDAITWLKTVPQGRPFFLYLATTAGHVPYVTTTPFSGKSAAGAYGDVIEELDYTVGTLMQALKDLGRDRNTLVLFTSDNGPVVPPGSAGPLQGGKGSLLEGGVREPGIVVWPGRIKPGRVSSEPVTMLDLFPTFLAMAGGTLPTDRAYDGNDITPLLTGEVDHIPGPGIDGGRELMYWYSRQPAALRSGKWKATRPVPGSNQSKQLFDLSVDPGETTDLSGQYPDLAKKLDTRIDELVP